MFKLALFALLPAVALQSAAAEARHREAVDSPVQLYVKCTTVGSEDYGGGQCTAFRAAMNKEITACMNQGANSSQGYRALRLRCVDQQRQRFTGPDA